jgi:hypothetical protein
MLTNGGRIRPSPRWRQHPRVLRWLRTRRPHQSSSHRRHSRDRNWTDEVIASTAVVVTMGCGSTCPFLPDVRYVDWDVGDPAAKTWNTFDPQETKPSNESENSQPVSISNPPGRATIHIGGQISNQEPRLPRARLRHSLSEWRAGTTALMTQASADNRSCTSSHAGPERRRYKRTTWPPPSAS